MCQSQLTHCSAHCINAALHALTSSRCMLAVWQICIAYIYCNPILQTLRHLAPLSCIDQLATSCKSKLRSPLAKTKISKCISKGHEVTLQLSSDVSCTCSRPCILYCNLWRFALHQAPELVQDDPSVQGASVIVANVSCIALSETITSCFIHGAPLYNNVALSQCTVTQ